MPINLRSSLLFWWPPQMSGWAANGAFEAGLRHARSFGGLLLLDLAFIGMGRPGRLWVDPRVSKRWNIHITFVVGQAFCSFLTVGFGVTGLLRPPMLMLVIGIGVIRSVRSVGLRGLRCTILGLTQADRATLMFGGIAALMLLGALLQTLAPTVTYDLLAYYFAHPRVWLAHGKYIILPFQHTDGYPRAFEQLYVLAFVSGDDVTARLLNAQPIIFSLLAMNAWLDERGTGNLVRTATAALFVTLPVSNKMIWHTGNDWAVVHAAIVALAMATSIHRIVSACLAGWLIALKFSGILPAAAIMLLMRKSISRRSLIGIVIGFLLVLPGWCRNTLVHGQPFYPLFWSAIPTFESSAALNPNTNAAHFASDLGLEGGVPAFLARPWLAFGGNLAVGDLTTGMISPAVQIILPIVFVLGASPLRSAFAIGFVLWVFLGGGMVRYAWPLLLPIIGEGCILLQRLVPQPAFVLVSITIALLQGMHSSCKGFETSNGTAVALGAEGTSAYLSRVVTSPPGYMLVADDSEQYCKGGKSYVLGDIKAYYWHGAFHLDLLSFKPLLARWIEESDTQERIGIRMRQEGIRHFVYEVGGMVSIHHAAPNAFRWSRARLHRWQDFWVKHAEIRGERIVPGWDMYVYYVDFVPHSGQAWPKTDVPFTIPGTEMLTVPGDDALIAGDRERARRWFSARSREWPEFLVLRRRLDAIGRLDSRIRE